MTDTPKAGQGADGRTPSVGVSFAGDDLPELLTLREVSDVLRVSAQWHYQTTEAVLGRLGVPILELGPKTRRVRKSDLIAALDRAAGGAGT